MVAPCGSNGFEGPIGVYTAWCKLFQTKSAGMIEAPADTPSHTEEKQPYANYVDQPIF